MRKATYIILAVIVIGSMVWYFSADNSSSDPSTPGTPSHEEAELTGFGFMNDFVKVAPPSEDKDAANRVYEALSENVKSKISKETLSRDLALFVGVQDVPDQGVSVENLIINEDGKATLVLGLNYSGSGRVLRNVNLIIEDGKWKVNSVSVPVETE